MNASPEGRRDPGVERAVLVIGDVMLDVIAAPERPLEAATDTPAAISLLPGGSGANQAAWLGHFGNAVFFVGRVGRDGYDEHAAALRRHGVEPVLSLDERARTGVLVTLIGPGGERSFLTDRGANARLARADLPAALLDRVGLVHVSGYALFAAQPRAAVAEYLALAAVRGLRVSVDSGSTSFLREIGPATFLEATRHATICFANAREAALLAGTADRDEQLARLAKRYATIVITDGPAGACAASARESERVAVAASVVEAVDTTGAGDAFLAGFLTSSVKGEPLASCVREGVAAGSSAVLHYGGRPPVRPSGAGMRTR